MFQNTWENWILMNALLKKASTESYVSAKESGHSTNSCDESNSVNSDWNFLYEVRRPKRSVCSNLISPSAAPNFDVALLQQYCLWGLNLAENTVKLQYNEFINPIWNLIPANNGGYSNGYYNKLWKPIPIVNKTKTELQRDKRSPDSANFDWQTQAPPQYTELNSVYETSNVGEQEDDLEKESYVKAVFQVTRINKATKKRIRLNKHRHVISHCEHVGAQYYARGMCKKCYFSVGKRKKKAYKCQHTDRSHYATGLCKLWYLKNYHKTHDRKKPREP